MFSTVCKGLIGNPIGADNFILIASADTLEDVLTVQSNLRTQLTVLAAQPALDEEQHAAVMATIRSLRIIDVRVNQVETM